MKGLKLRLRNLEGRARKTLKRTSTTLIILVTPETVPVEASPGMVRGWKQAITWLELWLLEFFTEEYVSCSRRD